MQSSLLRWLLFHAQKQVATGRGRLREGGGHKNPLTEARAHFYTGQRELARMCVLRSWNDCPNRHLLRRDAPYKGLHPLRCCASILANRQEQ